MLIQQSYRYELNPNNKQRTILAKQAGVARFAYNIKNKIDDIVKTPLKIDGDWVIRDKCPNPPVSQSPIPSSQLANIPIT